MERDTKSIEAACMAPLSKAHVLTRDAGRGGALSYVPGWYIDNRLCEVFGPLGWSKSTDVLEEVARFEETVKPRSGGAPFQRWRVCYRATVTLTAFGASKTDSGAGHGIDKDLGTAIESALKEAETDALKRAARHFGESFGNALYDKEQRNVQAPPNVRKIVQHIDDVRDPKRLKDAEDYAQSILPRVTSDEDRLAIIEAIARATSRVKKGEAA